MQAGVVPSDHSCIASAVSLFDRRHRREGGVSTARPCLENRCSWRSQATNPRWERGSISLPTARSWSLLTQTVNCRFSGFMNTTRYPAYTAGREKYWKVHAISISPCRLAICVERKEKKKMPLRSGISMVWRYMWRRDVQCTRRMLQLWCFSSQGASSHDCVLLE